MTDDERRARVEDVVRRFGDMIYRLAYQNTSSAADAEDILQDVCIAMLLKNAPLEDEERMRYWLVRVTLNKCHNLTSSASRRRNEPIDQAIHLYAEEDQSILEQVMELPPKYRNVIYLHYYEGYSIAEIASLLRVQPGTVGSWLSRARKRLKLLLEE